jgi:hypothetical protein
MLHGLQLLLKTPAQDTHSFTARRRQKWVSQIDLPFKVKNLSLAAVTASVHKYD